MGKRIVIVGSNFAGFAAALELQSRLAPAHEIVVLSHTDRFLFLPSLIWVPFGLRAQEEISFELKPLYDDRGIVFKHTTVRSLDPERRRVQHQRGAERYDYLLLATGAEGDYAAIPGLGPSAGYTQSIFDWERAELAREAFERFLEAPGPVVIGAAQGACCLGPAYEFLFNCAHQLRKRELARKAPLAFVTPEPYVGHFGMGGFGGAGRQLSRLFQRLDVRVLTNVAIKEIAPAELHLENGTTLPFAYAMIAPPFRSVDAVRSCTALAQASGFLEVDANYRSIRYPDVYAAGAAVYVPPPERTPVPVGVPRNGYLAEQMGRVAAHNIAAEIHGEPLVALPPAAIHARCVLDAGNTGLILDADHLLEPRRHTWLIPGPEAHWAKLAFERYFLATRRRGWI